MSNSTRAWTLTKSVILGGTIRIHANQIFLTTTLRENYVGLEEGDDGVYDLFFCFYQIGRYDLRKNKIKDIITKVPVSRPHDLEAPRVLPMSQD